MEATCQYIIYHKTDHPMSVDVQCGAPIPRLNEGPCEFQVPRTHRWGTYIGQTVSCWGGKHAHVNGGYNHAYLGPLATECENGHPVAVPTEAQR
jgi:hypothetical protein